MNVISRLLKNTRLLRCPHPSSLRRTGLYDSLLRISGALYPSVFEQPAKKVVFSALLAGGYSLVDKSFRPKKHNCAGTGNGNESVFFPIKSRMQPVIDTSDTALLKGSQGFIKHAESSQWTKESKERPDGIEEHCV